MKPVSSKLTIVFIAIIIISITAISFVGYIFNNPYLYGWSGGSGMAKNSAVCFILIGIALFILGNKKENN